MHNYISFGIGGSPVTQPLVMGHESAGIVVAIGDLVTTHKVGDRVASELSTILILIQSCAKYTRSVEPGLPCRRCTNCKNGRPNICFGEVHPSVSSSLRS